MALEAGEGADAYHALLSGFLSPQERVLVVTNTGGVHIRVSAFFVLPLVSTELLAPRTEPTSNSKKLTAEQIVGIRKALASDGTAPGDDIEEGEDTDGEDDQPADLLDELDSTTAAFFEDYCRFFGEEDTADLRSEILETNEEILATAELQPEVVSEPAVNKAFDHPKQVPVASELITTAALQRIAMSFNIRAKVVVCDRCHSGIPLLWIPRHLGACPGASEGPSFMTQRHAEELGLTDVIANELISSPSAGVAGVADIMNLVCAPTQKDYAGWRAASDRIFPPDPLEIPAPLEGILTTWRCTWKAHILSATITCDHSRATDSFQRPGQSLSNNKLLHRWAQVSRRLDFDAPTIIRSDDSDSSFLDRYIRLFTADHRASLEADFVSNNFHAVFQHSKVQEFLRDFKLSDIIGARTPLDLGLTQEQVEYLQAAHTDSFMESVDAVELAPEILRAQVMEGSRYAGDPQTLFTAPRKKASTRFYLRRERMLLLAVIKACQHRQPWPLTLSSVLDDLVTKLRAALRKSTGKENLKKQVEKVLDVLYFPAVAMKDVGHPFRSPVVAFLATFCKTETGDWASVKNLSSFLLAPAQFAIRARGLQRLVQIQGSSPDTALQTQIIPFCEEHLADHRVSPFSGVRFFMREWSIASRASPRPAMLSWADDNILNVWEKSLNVAELPAMTKEALAGLENYFQESVLCGIPLDLLCPSIDFQKFASGGHLTSVESQRFEEELLLRGKIGFTSGGSEITWDKRAGRAWRMVLHQATLRLASAMHTTGGLPPRTTDEELFRLNDLLFIAGGNTVGINSTTNKMLSRRGVTRSVTFVFPPVVAKLMFILVHIVRRVQLRLLLSDSHLSDHAELRELYESYLFVSMGSTITYSARSAALKAWTKQSFGLELSFGRYRHVATALQRHFLPTLSQNPLAAEIAPEVDNNRLQRTHAAMGEDGFMWTQMMIQQARDWHMFLGLS
ncbi:hypothetical protein B0H16DRAFT_1570161 [Mycena metata]|uniref:Uncharacterized protein n=1 Tax=Mycena metata TaxID=1033252 RepID=A0AAD7MYX9_9AGAR|nr:hypothetical protein B0H16DRAFT_1570161 [Mycena metata]